MAATRRERRVFSALHIVTGAVVVVGVFMGLPVRYAPVDLLAGVLAMALFVSGFGLLVRTRWSHRVARAVSWVTLVIGLSVTALLAITASHVAGLYGPIGRGGALIMVLVACLVVPYLVAIPVVGVHVFSRGNRR
jgi:uncharacterized membrane protein